MTQSIAGAKLQVRYPWMFGRNFDILFFFAPILLAVGVYYLAHSTLAAQSIFWAAVAGSAFGAGPFHQGPTLFAYFDAKNRQHYGSDPGKRRIFFLGPPAVLLLTIAGVFFCYIPTLIVWMLWSVQHLVQQNIGILLLYHRHGKGEAVVPKPLETKTQHAAAVLFSLIFINRCLLLGKLDMFMNVVIAGALIATIYFVGLYMLELIKQAKEGAYLNVPALGFWCVSMFSLWPLAFLGTSFDDAYLIPLTMHWFQYIGLNFVLVKNKYGSDEMVKNLPLSRPWMLFFGLCLTLVVFNLTIAIAQKSPLLVIGWQQTLAVGILLGLANVHYFLDAFIWRFREPFQRQTVLPYLIAGR